jgi:ribosomal protein L29
MATPSFVQVNAVPGDPIEVLCTGIIADTEGLVWQPSIPVGRYVSPALEQPFEITERDLEEIVTNFKAGTRTDAGISVNGDCFHRVQADGADAWIKDVRIAEGVLECALEFSGKGKRKVVDKETLYFSPSFTLHGPPKGKEWMYPGTTGSLLWGGALVDQPLFPDQPQLTIQASLCSIVEASAEAVRKPTIQEVTMNAEEARAKLEEKLGAPISDAEWAETSEGITDFAKLIEEYVFPSPISVETVLPPTGEDLAAEVERLKAELSAEREKVTVEASANAAAIAELKRDKAMTDTRIDIAGWQFSSAGDNGHPLSPARASVDVLASALVDPSTANVQALADHLKANGGLLLVEGGERVNVQSSVNPDNIEAYIAGLNNSDKVKAKIRSIHAKGGVTPQEAHRQAVKV